MTNLKNIMEVLNSPVGTKFTVKSTSSDNLRGETVIVKRHMNGTGLAHLTKSGCELQLAMNTGLTNATFEEKIEIEFEPTDFKSLKDGQRRQLYVYKYGEHQPVSIFEDLVEYSIRDIDDLLRKQFYFRKVNGVYETK